MRWQALPSLEVGGVNALPRVSLAACDAWVLSKVMLCQLVVVFLSRGAFI